jgi:uncharacterized protein DUF3303
MKYVVAWETPEFTSEELQARGLAVFGSWSPSEGADFQQFLGRVDGRGGFAVIEADDPALLAKDVATFAPFFKFSVHPVLEVQQTAGVAMEAVQFRNRLLTPVARSETRPVLTARRAA